VQRGQVRQDVILADVKVPRPDRVGRAGAGVPVAAAVGGPIPRPGQRWAVADSAGKRVAVIETIAVRVLRLVDVDLAHALGEGEGYTSVAHWRAAHEQFWHSAEMQAELGGQQISIDDDTLVIAEQFRLVESCKTTRPIHADSVLAAQSDMADRRTLMPQ